MTKTAELADVVLPASNSRVRVRGDRHEQRAPGAAGAQGARPAGQREGRHLDHRASSRNASARDWGELTPHDGVGGAAGRSARCTPGCRTSGSTSWAGSSGRAPTRPTRARSSCTRGCGPTTRPSKGRRRRSRSWCDDPPVDELTDEFPLRLTTGRRLDSYNTGVQTGGYTSPLRRRRDDRRLARGRRAARPWPRARSSRSRRGGGRSRRRYTSTTALRPGLVFMTFHFPDQVDTNVLTIEATDPKSGTAEFKATAVRIDKLPAPVAGGSA